MNKIIKRNSEIVEYNSNKIKSAIKSANHDLDNKFSDAEIEVIYEASKNEVEELLKTHNVSVEEINDIVEKAMMKYDCYELAKQFIEYRYRHKLIRESNTTDESIFELINGKSEYWNEENSNKNARLVTTQRDYIAGIVNTDIARRFLLPKDVVKAHDEGIIHEHDMDYLADFARHNCELINLDDMLQNGTVLNGVMIEKPHRLITASTIATQIMTAVSASTYGGLTITLTHLAPFVRNSFYFHYKFFVEKILNQQINPKLDADTEMCNDLYLENKLAYKYATEQLNKEIEDSVQTFNYQINSMSSTNGQAPFCSVFMYLNETDEYKDELALLIKEFLVQRIKGLKNEKGVYVTQAFPKLLYVLEEDNIREDSKYWYLTELSAKCSAKRLVPDYISEKVMRRLKINKFGYGDVYGPMGCVAGNEVITYKFNHSVYIETFEKMWDRLAKAYEVKYQPNNKDLYIDTDGVEIYDQTKGFVKNLRVIKNHNKKWLKITFSDGRILTCTPDHPFETMDKGVVKAQDLTDANTIEIDCRPNNEIDKALIVKTDVAWLNGFMFCNGTIGERNAVMIDEKEDQTVIDKITNLLKNEYKLNTEIVSKNRLLKGYYKDIEISGEKVNYLNNLRKDSFFEELYPEIRTMSSEIFKWVKNSQLAFIAGMVDASGSLSTTGKLATIKLETFTKQTALQMMLLIQSCGMYASLYENDGRYKYRVEFTPTQELLDYIVSPKKKDIKKASIERKNKPTTCHMISVEEFEKEDFSYDVSTGSEHFTVSGLYSHNCRSFLTPDRIEGNPANALNYDPNKGKYWGRFNMGVCTVNLFDAALSSNRNESEFWKLLDERCELCHSGLKVRINRLASATSDVAPILWQYGALARLKPHEKIEKLVYGGYSTASLGYAALYECVKYMTGLNLTDKEGEAFGMRVMNFLNDKCAKWKKEENIDYSVYGTPLETTTYKFAKMAKKRFGEDVFVNLDGHDREYVTNSSHTPVFQNIDAFDKLDIDGKFQELSPGGNVIYIETPNLQNNIEAIIEVIKYMYDHTMYGELNTKSDYCMNCGYDGEIMVVEDEKTHKLVWECPNCKNRDQNKMQVTRRTCGYLGSHYWNQGRTDEIRSRVMHLDNVKE